MLEGQTEGFELQDVNGEPPLLTMLFKKSIIERGLLHLTDLCLFRETSRIYPLSESKWWSTRQGISSLGEIEPWVNWGKESTFSVLIECLAGVLEWNSMYCPKEGHYWAQNSHRWISLWDLFWISVVKHELSEKELSFLEERTLSEMHLELDSYSSRMEGWRANDMLKAVCQIENDHLPCKV